MSVPKKILLCCVIFTSCYYGVKAVSDERQLQNIEIENNLIRAIRFAQVNNVREIISRGIDVSFFYQAHRPLYYAIEALNFSRNDISFENSLEDSMEILRILLEVGFDPNLAAPGAHIPGRTVTLWYIDGGITPIMMSIIPDATRLLIDFGADINRQDMYGRTALMIHSFFRENDIVELLIDNGATINYTDNVGRTVLHYTGFDIPLWELLIRNGADIYLRDNNGISFFIIAHWFIQNLHSENRNNVIKFLEKIGAIEINAKDRELASEFNITLNDLHFSYADR